MISIEEAISVGTKEDIETKTNIKEVSNLNVKSRSAKTEDKKDTRDVVEIEKTSKIPITNILKPLAIKIW